MQDHFILAALSVAILLTYVGFIIEFSRDPWWRTPLGQSLMVLAFAIVIFSLLAVTRQFLGPDYWGREWFLGIGRFLVLVAGLQRWYVLRKARRNPEYGRNYGARR